MGNAEEEARREAVARVLAGEPPGKVAADLGRTDQWVRKWVARYDPSHEEWAEERSHAPRTQARRTPEDIERVVLEIRARLMANPWAQVGATAIAWEMEKLKLEPPETWTIDRILKRAGVPKRRARHRYVPKGTPYPQAPRARPPQRRPRDRPRRSTSPDRRHPLLRAQRSRPRPPASSHRDPERQRGVGGGRWPHPAVAPARCPQACQVRQRPHLPGTRAQLAVPVWICLEAGVRSTSSRSQSHGAIRSSSTSTMSSTSASFAPRDSRISHTSDAEHEPSSASTTPIIATRSSREPPLTSTRSGWVSKRVCSTLVSSPRPRCLTGD